MAQPAPASHAANTHAMARIFHASESRTILASQDIYDDTGVKLWARSQPISRSLHERLLERKLRVPIESCLQAADGVTAFELHRSLATCLDADTALTRAVGPHANHLLGEVRKLPVHPVVQLLLTTAQATAPDSFRHAVQGMALAGALQAASKPGSYEIRVALLGGLLHDLGEIYVNPVYLDASTTLDVAGYRHVIAHPRIGEMLLSGTTDYPAELAQAIGQHHERLDGSGYPARRKGATISWLGRLLATTETALGILAAQRAPLKRTSVALQMLPGEYDPALVGFFSRAAAAAKEDLVSPDDDTAPRMRERLDEFHKEITRLRDAATAVGRRTAPTDAVARIAADVFARVSRLESAGHSMGIWNVPDIEMQPAELFELSMAKREINYRLSNLERDVLWPYPQLSESELSTTSEIFAVTA